MFWVVVVHVGRFHLSVRHCIDVIGLVLGKRELVAGIRDMDRVVTEGVWRWGGHGEEQRCYENKRKKKEKPNLKRNMKKTKNLVDGICS